MFHRQLKKICRILVLVLIVSGFVRGIYNIAWAENEINLVENGDFSEDEDGNNIPDFWETAGGKEIQQELTLDAGRDGKGYSAKLSCTDFINVSAASHAMIAQVNKISVERNKWYRLSFWAKDEGTKGDLYVTLQNTQSWKDVGLYKTFNIKSKWQKFEILFQAPEDLLPGQSRFAFYFFSTGILWLDGVEIVEVEEKMAKEETRIQWHPQLPTKGIINFIPNSSFECYAEGWGSYSPEIGQGLYQLFGELDNTTAAHGKYSLRMHLSENTLPMFNFGYNGGNDPIHQQVKCILAAHYGWVPVKSGKSYTLSAFLKADKQGVVGVLFIRQAGASRQNKDFSLSTDWQRFTFTFIAEKDFVCAGVGLNLKSSKFDEATVWIDAVQFEEGSQASSYQTNMPVEVMATTGVEGNIFVCDQPPYNIPLQLHAFNNTTSPQKANVIICVKNFFDDEILRKTVSLLLQAQTGAIEIVSLPVEKVGFYRILLQVSESETILSEKRYFQQLRCAVIKPFTGDSRFGMNHAYPWEFLLRLAKKSGIVWWRDWSVAWDTVQPRCDATFDFSKPDIQIDRPLKEGGKVLILFPYPSSSWASSADTTSNEWIKISKQSRRHALLAPKPNDEGAFARYISESVKHYRDRVQYYQIFNEPLYTSYALPAQLGHKMEDYVNLLRIACQTIKTQQPDAVVIGGIGIWADNKLTKDFVQAGGLQFADVLDVHTYPAASKSEKLLCESLEELWEEMKQRNEAKPIWLTELGCFADDDPPVTPIPLFSSAGMQKSLHSSELESSKWFVRFAAIFFANGGKKIFLQAGTCGPINSVDAEGTLFEYGGTPRKLYTAIAAMANLLPPEAEFKQTTKLGEKVIARWFSTAKAEVAVAWSDDNEPHKVQLPGGTQAFDMLGNLIAGSSITVTEFPVYLIRR